MNFILGIPFALRLVCLFCVGAIVGGLANWAIYRLAYHVRWISPWSSPPDATTKRGWPDRIPIVGWWAMRRESHLHGRGFWIRPLLLEVAVGIGFAALYWWETAQRGLIMPELLALWQRNPGLIPANLHGVLHQQYFSHLILISLMIVASMIDIDETTIPDAITIPGTLIGLIIATSWPWSLLPHDNIVAVAPRIFGHQLEFLRFSSPLDWPQRMSGAQGLLVGLGCFWLWCIALLPRPWRTRHGLRRAWAILIMRIRRERFSLWILAIAILGSMGIVGGWLLGGERWQALLSSLVGLAVGGGMIWLVRIIGKATLKKEAMGFGDVTLMAMVGAFVGWQACLIIFFLAPFAALAVGIVQLVLIRENLIPYGPFLCLATLGVIVRWGGIWEWAMPLFYLGWFIPLAMLGCMALMGVLLMVVRFITSLLFDQQGRG